MDTTNYRAEFHTLAVDNGWKEFPGEGDQVQYLRKADSIIVNYLGDYLKSAVHSSPCDGLDYIRSGGDSEQVIEWLTEGHHAKRPAPVTSDRIMIHGVIEFGREETSDVHPDCYKIRVVTDDGWSVWAPMPYNLEWKDDHKLIGRRIRFECTITPSNNPTFVYGSDVRLGTFAD